jgi:ligand-binding sensor domain-containing protein
MPALTSSFMLSMAKAEDGTIWVSTENEILQVSNCKPKVVLPFLNNQVKFIRVNGLVYAKTRNEIYSYNGRWAYVVSIEYDRFDRIHEANGKLMLFDQDSLFTLDNGLIQLVSVKPGLRHLNNSLYRSESNNGEAEFFILRNNDLEKLSNNKKFTLQTEEGETEFASKTVSDSLDNSVTLFDSYLRIRNGNMAEVFSLQGDLDVNHIGSIYIAPNGIVWLGTSSNGLLMFYPKTFKTIQSDARKNKNGFMVYQSQDSTIWFDEPCEALFAVKPDQAIEKFHIDLCSWTMVQDSSRTIWIGQYRGLCKFNNQLTNTGFVPYHNDLDGKYTYSLFKRRDETILVGTNEGIFYLKGDSLFTVKSSEKIGKVYSFYEDLSGTLLACSDQGLIVLDTHKIYRVYSEKDGLPTNDIRSIYQDEDLNYWIGTSQKGLCCYNSTSGLIQLPTEDGRLNRNVWCIIEDELGYFWMNSNQGIYRVSRLELLEFIKGKQPGFSSQHFTNADGLENSEGNSRTQNRAFKSYTGDIWFSMISGPAFIDPTILKNKPRHHAIIIDEVFIDKKKVNPNSKINIGPDQSQIQVSFSHPVFTHASHLDYYYKIDGLDDRWFEVGRSRLMTFSELPAGDFTLRIKQIGSENETAMDFTVEVHFWETELFKIFLVFFITSFIFLIGFRIWQKNRKGQAEIKRMSFDLKSLELRALQSQMNPHFIFNCLSSIQSLFILGDLNRANEYMSQFSALLRLILEHAQKRLVTLKEDLDMFNIYVPLERMQFDKPFEFKLEVQDGIDPERYYIPTMVTHTFIENAIKHGLKPLKERDGKLSIYVSKNEKNLILAIKDNGIGYERSLLTKKINKSKHKSRGLQITNRRIDLLNLLSDLNIQVTSFDLKDEHNKPCGTEVRLMFPIIEKDEDINR